MHKTHSLMFATPIRITPLAKFTPIALLPRSPNAISAYLKEDQTTFIIEFIIITSIFMLLNPLWSKTKGIQAPERRRVLSRRGRTAVFSIEVTARRKAALKEFSYTKRNPEWRERGRAVQQ